MQIAREIVSAIDVLHGANIIHLNLTTANVLVNADTNLVKIIGFTSSSTYETISYEIGNNKRLNKYSKHIPPEQTGYTNSYVDYRSDIYDLGMIFYFSYKGVEIRCMTN